MLCVSIHPLNTSHIVVVLQPELDTQHCCFLEYAIFSLVLMDADIFAHLLSVIGNLLKSYQRLA